MALLILCDPRYRNNNWCETKLRGIYDEAARRRMPVKLYTDLSAFASVAAKLGNDSSVIVLFNSMKYLAEVAEVLAPMAIHPILSVTESEIRFPRVYSQVCGDVDSATGELVQFLHAKGKRRIMLIGVSQNSAAGRNKIEMIRRHVPKGEYAVIYDEQGNLTKSFESFLPVRDQFDAVVCTNDHQAIALVEFLQAHGAYDPSLYIISHGDTILARLYGDGITTISTGFYACGKAMVEAHFHRLKYNWSTVMIRVHCEFRARGSTSGAGTYPTLPFIPPHANQAGLSRLECVLADCDLANLKLIFGLLSDYSYEHMGELCFLSAGAVKYRVQQMRQALGCKSREEMTALLGRYLEKERLLHVVEEAEGIGGKIFG